MTRGSSARGFGRLGKTWWLCLLAIVVLAASLVTYHLLGTNPADLPATSQEADAVEQKGPVYEIGSEEYDLEVVDTPAERNRGLSGKSGLSAGMGMLFVFEELGDYGIWMKEMNFALDIIWLDDNRQVVGLEENVQPSSYPNVYRADAESLYVIEINAGAASQAGLELGDRVGCRPVSGQQANCFPRPGQ